MSSPSSAGPSASRSSKPRVILYGYATSPFYQKMLFLLAHYRVEFAVVKVANMPPRPALSELLGITYRRIPVMFLDGQAYFETTLCAQVLDETFGNQPGYGPSLFSHTNPTVQIQLASTWLETNLFHTAISFLPRAAFTPAFVADRTQCFPGASFDADAIERTKPYASVQLASHLSSLEALLAAPSPPFLTAQTVQYLDICAFFLVAWIRAFGTAPQLAGTGPYPHLKAWLDRVETYLKERGAFARPTFARPEEALALIREQAGQGSNRVEGEEAVGSDPLGRAGWVERVGDHVAVTPTDSGRVPQRGYLVALTPATVTIRIPTPGHPGSAGVLAHFPRRNFDVRKVEMERKSQGAKL